MNGGDWIRTRIHTSAPQPADALSRLTAALSGMLARWTQTGWPPLVARLASEVTEFSLGQKVVAGFLPGVARLDDHNPAFNSSCALRKAHGHFRSVRYAPLQTQVPEERRRLLTSLPLAAPKSGLRYVITTFSGLFQTRPITRCSFLTFVGGMFVGTNESLDNSLNISEYIKQ